MLTYGRSPISGVDRSSVSAGVALVERFAAIGLASLLIASAAYAVFAAVTMRASVRALVRTAAIDEAYETARYDVGAEESLERKYRLEPSRGVRAAHEGAANELAGALTTVARLDASERRAIDGVLRSHARYRRASAELFAAVDVRRPQLALRIDRERVDPVFASIERYVDATAARRRSEIGRIAARMSHVQLAVIRASILLPIASVACLFAYFAVMQSYKRRLRRSHAAEIERLAAAASLDPLTGVGNHRAYKDALARETARAVRTGEGLTLALIDVDDMTSINEQHGHVHGDHVLSTLGDRLRGSHPTGRPFRIGGDRFAVVLPDTSAADAAALMRRLPAGSPLLGAAVGVGIATLCGGACDAELLEGQADAALYAAKRAGRNTVTVFDEAVDEMWLLSPTKLRRLRELIANEDVRIAFQPIWDLDRCAVLAFEALARPAAAYGFAGPQDVFDLAERAGRAHEIDAVCRRATLRRAAELPAGALLFVNMTPQSFDRGHLDPATFHDDVLAAGLTPERVVVEITERSVVRIDVVVAFGRALQQLGFRLALDDTGAGNAGLEMLSRLAVEFVKIDRDIVVKAMTDRGARGVMAGIVAIARATDAYVIAEGIEDDAMLELVCATDDSVATSTRGIRGVQGYLLQRPSETFATAREFANVRTMLRDVSARSGDRARAFARA